MLVEVYSEISDAYARLSHALSELAKFLSPVSILLPIKLKKNCKTGLEKKLGNTCFSKDDRIILGNEYGYIPYFWEFRSILFFSVIWTSPYSSIRPIYVLFF